jgi:hypothetical protein
MNYANASGLDSTIKGDAVVELDVVDGSTTPLNNANVVLKFDNAVVVPTFPKAGNVTTVTFDPPGEMAPGSKHTVELTFPTGVGAAVDVVTFDFWVSPFSATTLFVEAEDLNYDSGLHKPEASVISPRYTGAAYAGLTATLGIDYNDPGTVENAAYRADISVSMVAHFDVTRWDVDLTENYKVGWNDPGDWFNYTRTFAAGNYKVYGDHSSDGADIHTKLSLVNGATTDQQVVADVGNFDAVESNGWDTFRTIQLKDSAGNPVILGLSGERTLRLTINPSSNEDVNFLAFVPTTEAAPFALATLSPASGSVISATADTVITGSVIDGSGVVNASSLTMTINGTASTAVPSKSGTFSTLSHTLPAPGYGAVINVVFNWMEGATPKQLVAVLRSGGTATYRKYLGIGGSQSLDEIYASVQWTDNAPDEELLVPWFEVPNNQHEGYGMHLLGYVIPTESGNYTFYSESDDNGIFYLSTDDKPVNKRVIGRQANWNGYREWNTDGGGSPVANRVSAPIALVAGTRYYIEALAKEGGGGDNCGIAWRRVGIDPPINNGDPPITFEVRPFNTADFDVVPQGGSFNKGVPILLTSHLISGPGGAVTYEWFKDGSATAIPGANGPTLDLGASDPTDEGSYVVRATIAAPTGPSAPGGAIVANSPPAVVDFVDDTTPPDILGVSVKDLANLVVIFNEGLTGAPTIAISGGITVKGVTATANPARWVVNTSVLAPGTVYTLTATGASDLAGNAAPPRNRDFSANLVTGFARRETYQGIGGNSVQGNLVTAPTFPDSPTTSDLVTSVDGEVNIRENYGTRLTGYFIAPSTDNYVFFISSDDNGELYLSTDEDPANKLLIATETSWSNPRQWAASDNGGTDLASKRSDQFPGSLWPTGGTISLTQGRRYYFEVLGKEGGGGDNTAATYKLEAAADPANGTQALTGNVIAAIADPFISITAPASGANVNAGTAVNITTAVTAGSGVAKVEFFANGALLGESTTAPYSFVVPGVAVVPGRYTLTARVTDGSGVQFTSPGVVATVHPTAPTKRILFVHGGGGPNASDVAAINRLFGRNFDVTAVGSNADSVNDAAGKDAVIVSSTGPSGETTATYKDVTIGVGNWEAAIQDDMLLTLNVDLTDRGTTGGLTTIAITAAGAAHQIGAGFAAGDLVIYSTGSDISWGLPNLSGANATSIATVAGQANQHAVYAYDKGDTLIDGTSIAAGRRAHIPMGDNSFNNLNDNGKKLFDQIVDWLVAPPDVGGQPELDVAVTETQITVTWTNGGTLYTANAVDAASGAWTSTGDSDGSYSVARTPGASALFFMVKK